MAIDRTYIPYEGNYLEYGFGPEHLFFDYGGTLGIGDNPLEPPSDGGGGGSTVEQQLYDQFAPPNAPLPENMSREEAEGLSLGGLTGQRSQGYLDIQITDVQRGNSALAQHVIGRTEEQTRAGQLALNPGGAFIGFLGNQIAPGVSSLMGWSQDTWNGYATNPENVVATFTDQHGRTGQAIIGPNNDILAVSSTDMPQEMFEQYVRENLQQIASKVGAKTPELSPAPATPDLSGETDLSSFANDPIFGELIGSEMMDPYGGVDPFGGYAPEGPASAPQGPSPAVTGQPQAPVNVGPPGSDIGYRGADGGVILAPEQAERTAFGRAIDKAEQIMGPGYDQLSPQQQAELQGRMTEIAGKMPDQEKLELARDMLRGEEYSKVGAGPQYSETATPPAGAPSGGQQSVVSGAMAAGGSKLAGMAKDLLDRYSPAQLVGGAMANPAMTAAIDQVAGGAASKAKAEAAAAEAARNAPSSYSAPAPYSAPGITPVSVPDISVPTRAEMDRVAAAKQAQLAAEHQATVNQVEKAKQDFAAQQQTATKSDTTPFDVGAGNYLDVAEDMFGKAEDYEFGPAAAPGAGVTGPSEFSNPEEPGEEVGQQVGVSNVDSLIEAMAQGAMSYGSGELSGANLGSVTFDTSSGAITQTGPYNFDDPLPGEMPLDYPDVANFGAQGAAMPAGFQGYLDLAMSDPTGWEGASAAALDENYNAQQPSFEGLHEQGRREEFGLTGPVDFGPELIESGSLAGMPVGTSLGSIKEGGVSPEQGGGISTRGGNEQSVGPTSPTTVDYSGASQIDALGHDVSGIGGGPDANAPDTAGDVGGIGGGYGGGSVSDVEAADPGQGGIGADPDNDPDAPGPAWHAGGYVEGPDPTRRGEDVDATIKEGEFVLSPEIVDIMGPENLAALQKAANSNDHLALMMAVDSMLERISA